MAHPHASPAQKISHTPRQQQGIVLVEVLVAILLFALGILALVGLQGALTRAQTDAKIRTDASYLASELAATMWGDISNISAYDGTGCASHTLCKSWQDKVARSLPSGAGAVTVASSDVQVTVTWQLPGGDTHTYVTHTTIVKSGT